MQVWSYQIMGLTTIHPKKKCKMGHPVMVCPDRLKCLPVASTLLSTYLRCSVSLSLSLLCAWPTYCCLQLAKLHVMAQHTFLVSQSSLVSNSTVQFVAVALNVFPCWIQGQTAQVAFPHFFIPGTTLLGLAAALTGTFALSVYQLSNTAI